MTKGYWVVRANVFNVEKYSEYVKLATNIIQQFNGKFLIRGGNQIEFEEAGFDRTVVVEFKSYQDALDCYNSESYQSAMKFVRNSSKRLVVVVEGLG
tara:strand:+ start:2305 stop:2595 length:291 start_codon:yes stop_codon:yes gene_type:complete